MGFRETSCRAAASSIVREDVEWQIESLLEFILPLLDQIPRADDEASAQIAARQQFLDQSPAMIVLPAPGSSASRKRSGWRESIRRRPR